MKYKYLNTNTIVESDTPLDSAIFTPVKTPAKKKTPEKKQSGK